VVQPAHRAGDAFSELLDQGLAIAIGAELGPDSKTSKGFHLCGCIGAVAIALHQLEVVIIGLALAREASRFQEGRRHGAAGGKAHALALAGGAIALTEIGNGQLDRLGGGSGHRESAEIPKGSGAPRSSINPWGSVGRGTLWGCSLLNPHGIPPAGGLDLHRNPGFPGRHPGV